MTHHCRKLYNDQIKSLLFYCTQSLLKTWKHLSDVDKSPFYFIDTYLDFTISEFERLIKHSNAQGLFTSTSFVICYKDILTQWIAFCPTCGSKKREVTSGVYCKYCDTCVYMSIPVWSDYNYSK